MCILSLYIYDIGKSSIHGSCAKFKWLGSREHLKLKPSIFPSNIGFSGSSVPQQTNALKSSTPQEITTKSYGEFSMVKSQRNHQLC